MLNVSLFSILNLDKGGFSAMIEITPLFIDKFIAIFIFHSFSIPEIIKRV